MKKLLLLSLTLFTLNVFGQDTTNTKNDVDLLTSKLNKLHNKISTIDLDISKLKLNLDLKKITKFSTIYGAVNGGTSLSNVDVYSVTDGLQTTTIETPYDYSVILGVRKIARMGYEPKEAFKNGQEKILYDNDNSKFSNAEYGIISDIFSIGNSNYLTISSTGIYRYDYNLNSFSLIYSNEKKIIPIKNKIQNRIQNDNEFHFIDGDKYLSLNTNSLNTKVLYDNFDVTISDLLECSSDGNIFYAITENNSLLKFRRSENTFELLNKYQMSFPAHTISDVGDLVFLLKSL